MLCWVLHLPRLVITRNMEIIREALRTIAAAAAAHTPHVWGEVNKWTQLFDATVIFIHMDLSAASERIVRTHLNHRQPLLPMTGTVLTSAQR